MFDDSARMRKAGFLGALLLSATAVVFGQPTFTNTEDAVMVLGQGDFTALSTTLDEATSPWANSVAFGPNGAVAIAGQRGRVMVWNTMPTTNGAAASVIVGKSSFSETSWDVSQTNVSTVDGIAFSGSGKLLVADSLNNRILIWNAIPATNGAPADVVIGQSDFTSSACGATASALCYPTGVTFGPGGKLIVADAGNNRVLIFNSIPSTNGAAADIVIGQSGFGLNSSGNGAAEMYAPWHTAVAPNGRLIVADQYNHRVLIFDSIPTTNGASAALVLGQTGFGSSTPGTSASSFTHPSGVAVSANGQLAISEYGNHRVILYDTVPTTSGAAADVVLGQADLNGGTEFYDGVNAHSMGEGYGIAFDSQGRLWVTGRTMHRAMVFGDEGPIIGSMSMTSGSADGGDELTLVVNSASNESYADLKVYVGGAEATIRTTLSKSVAVKVPLLQAGSLNDVVVADVSGKTVLPLAWFANFNDVSASHPAQAAVESLRRADITAGCGGGNFCPEASLTRAQMAVLFVRAIHGAAFIPPVPSMQRFADVPLSSGYARWIEQFAIDGLTGGCGGGNYCPNGTATRAQAAVFLVQAKKGLGYVAPAPTGGVFHDVAPDTFAAKFIEFLGREGITTGCGDGNFCPTTPITRAQFAVMLKATLDIP